MNSTPVVPAFSRDKHHTDGKSEYIRVSEIEQDHMITLMPEQHQHVGQTLLNERPKGLNGQLAIGTANMAGPNWANLS